jgi:membrane protease YdiL (CAAX protease family)
MPSWPDHLLVVVLTVFFPIRAATFGYRRLRLAPLERVADVRRGLYLQAMAIQWALSALMLAIWLAHGRSARALGLVPREPRLLAWGMVGAVVIALVFWFVRHRVRGEPAALGRVFHKLRHLERMLPHTAADKRQFHLVSLSAGICEELLYRGYLLWYLSRWLDVIPAVAVSSVIFGVGHAYQGAKGILQTGLVGVVMALIYLSSGSLWPAIAVHAIIDMHTGELAYSALNWTRGIPAGIDLHSAEASEVARPDEEPAP